MLSPHGIDPLKPWGGIPSITQMDVASMLSGCSDCQTSLLLAKYAHDDKARDKLTRKWHEKAMSHGEKDQDRFIVMYDAVLIEYLGGDVCEYCDGISEVYIKPSGARLTLNEIITLDGVLNLVDGKVEPCGRCTGGRKAWSYRKIARLMQIERLSPNWIRRVEDLRGELRELERGAVANMKPFD